MKPNRPSAVLFDYNGTIVFDGPANIRSWETLMKELGVTTFRYDDFWGTPNDQIFRHFFPDWPQEKLDYYSEYKEKLYYENARAGYSQHNPGVFDRLNEIQNEGIPLIIVTASIWNNVKFYFEFSGLDKWFDINQTVYDDGHVINKTEMYREGAKRLGVDPKECTIVDDSYFGIIGAKELHPRKIIGVNYGSPDYAEKRKEVSDILINTFEEITIDDF